MKKNEFPSHKLRAVTEIEILGQRIMLPATGLFDAGTPPKTSCSVKIKEPAASAPSGLLEQQMPVQKHRLNPGKERVPAVQMSPASLDHADIWIGKEIDRAP